MDASGRGEQPTWLRTYCPGLCFAWLTEWCGFAANVARERLQVLVALSSVAARVWWMDAQPTWQENRAFGQSPRFVSHGCKSRWGDQRGPGAAFETLLDFVSHGRLGIGIGQRGWRLTFDVFGFVSHGHLFSVVGSVQRHDLPFFSCDFLWLGAQVPQAPFSDDTLFGDARV
ncbi:hypothetical protein V495_04825 [Pseudogymnoascus sp. VKM F-4514 (FW-929)]|nr:hypothetical protein V495_04825 [Pseudogymnoascus sp. VKM F-4514 (FW-929)]KFY64036.1 hypothetical protein V497_01848 [Pseudogymnoascus sp. VKM F-4516 (FW-969)]